MTRTTTVTAWAPTDTEWAVTTRYIYDAFGVPEEPEKKELETKLRPADRRVAVADDEGIFGGCFAYDFRLSLPGGTACQVGGLAGVGISPVAQGRGGLRAMMHTHLQQSIDLGDTASVLMASESGIYQRYGYGVATEMVRWQLNTQLFALFESAPVSSEGKISLLHNRSEAIAVLAGIHTKYCENRAMEVVRDELWWRYMLEPADADWVAIGKNKFVAVHYNNEKVADGYALYSIGDNSDSGFTHGNANSTVVLTEICAHTIESEISLFSYLTTLPWCRQLVWELGPVDPPLRHFMTDPRQLWQQSRVDMLWLRPLDVKRLLTERSYGCDGRVVIDYNDAQFPQLSGRWLLTVESGKPRLQVSASEHYVALGPSDFATVYAGTTRVAELASVAKVTGDSESIATLDRMLLADRPPFNSTRF